MYTLAPDEKTALVMIYTQTAMLRGEVVVKSALTRVSTWLRTQGAPEYIHLLGVQILDFNATPAKTNKYSEFYLSTQQVLAFHLAPPASDPLDYDQYETNRIMLPVSLHVGTFIFNGAVRIAGNTPLGAYLEASHSPWISVYDLAVSNPTMPALQYQVPMALLCPGKVLIGI